MYNIIKFTYICGKNVIKYKYSVWFNRNVSPVVESYAFLNPGLPYKAGCFVFKEAESCLRRAVY